MRRAHRRCHGHHGYGWAGPWGSPYGHGYSPFGGGFGRHHMKGRMMLHALFSRIDASPAQERAIVAEVERLQDRLRASKAGMHEARGDLAAAVRGPMLDDAALGAVLGRVDAATGDARAAVIEALRGIHGVLDDRQRHQVADMIDQGPRGWWRPSWGPYR
ncbi:MAG TPA: periplasmic heavy metal sensor [Kofleriaceae bacterium]|nr:periplasmic heavy metal sensor [Kofleriaceae bacterium]